MPVPCRYTRFWRATPLARDHRAVKLETTCIHVDRAAFVSLHSFTRCIAVGDDVVTSIPGGHREICRVTGVTPVAESYADAKYSYN